MILNPKDRYKCSYCKETYRLKYNLREHLREKHKQEVRYDSKKTG